MAEYLRKEYGDLKKVASDNNDDKDDDDDSNSKDIEVVEISTGEVLKMLDRFVNLRQLWKGERNSLITMKVKLKKIKLLYKNQSHINDYFILE